MEKSVEQISRRQFLIRLGGATAAITVVGAGLGLLLRDRAGTPAPASLPDAPPAAPERLYPVSIPERGSLLEPAPGTRPEYTPIKDHYRVDINFAPPNIDASQWRLRISGLVDSPLDLTLDQIRARWEPLHQFVTLSCISNPVGGDLIGTTLWTGASLQEVLADAGVQPGAERLMIRSRDGFYETIELGLVDSDPRIMLAYAMDGNLLEVPHGFPLRVYIPDRYGMKQPKWIEEIEVISAPADGYWVERGWDREALVRTTSVIDTVAKDAIFERGGQMIVPVGGIAYAGAKGISKVEVRVGREGVWQEAALRQPISDLTWVLWRFDWPFEEGRHIFFVRAYDGSGQIQIAEENPPAPSGATGIHWDAVDF